MIGFGYVPLKREGAIADTDAYTWECNLDECADCRKYYLEWKQKYLEQERRYDPRTISQHPHPDQRLGVAYPGAQSADPGLSVRGDGAVHGRASEGDLEMKLTPWFPGSVRPARPGVYERRFGLTDTQRYAYWDGYFWGIGGITPEESLLYKRSRSAAQLKAMGVMWRGLAEEPEKT